MAENKDEEVSDAELQSGSEEEEEELDLSNPDVVTKYKMAAEIANRTFRRSHPYTAMRCHALVSLNSSAILLPTVRLSRFRRM
jgi:hypothetical protein